MDVVGNRNRSETKPWLFPTLPQLSSSPTVRALSLLADQREVKAFANVLSVRSIGNELRLQFLEKRKHLFSDGVDEHDFREIDDDLQFVVAARDEAANLLSSLAGESTLEPADQSTV